MNAATEQAVEMTNRRVTGTFALGRTASVGPRAGRGAVR